MTTVEIARLAQELAILAHWIVPAVVLGGAVLGILDHYFDSRR